MVRLLLQVLGDDLLNLLASQWLDVRSLVTLDIAVSSNTLRPYWMTLLGYLRSPSIDNMDHCAFSLMWLIQRGICATRIHMKVNAWRIPGCDFSLLKTVNLLHLGLNCCSSVTDECISKVVSSCDGERGDGSGRCSGVSDHGIIALDH